MILQHDKVALGSNNIQWLLGSWFNKQASKSLDDGGLINSVGVGY